MEEKSAFCPADSGNSWRSSCELSAAAVLDENSAGGEDHISGLQQVKADVSRFDAELISNVEREFECHTDDLRH